MSSRLGVTGGFKPRKSIKKMIGTISFDGGKRVNTKSIEPPGNNLKTHRNWPILMLGSSLMLPLSSRPFWEYSVKDVIAVKYGTLLIVSSLRVSTSPEPRRKRFMAGLDGWSVLYSIDQWVSDIKRKIKNTEKKRSSEFFVGVFFFSLLLHNCFLLSHWMFLSWSKLMVVELWWRSVKLDAQ